jgi:hypothetical protein
MWGSPQFRLPRSPSPLNPGQAARYDSFWFVEYDVDFTGDWGTFFSAMASTEADLLGTTLYPRSQSESWCHWNAFRAPVGLAAEHQVRGFFPIVRLSRQFAHVYRNEIPNGWSGHYEALWPSIALHRKFRIEDIGGTGPFVPPARQGRFYTNSDDPILNAGTFRYRPPVAGKYYPHSAPQIAKDHLCHPVKTVAYEASQAAALRAQVGELKSSLRQVTKQRDKLKQRVEHLSQQRKHDKAQLKSILASRSSRITKAARRLRAAAGRLHGWLS